MLLEKEDEGLQARSKDRDREETCLVCLGLCYSDCFSLTPAQGWPPTPFQKALRRKAENFTI